MTRGPAPSAPAPPPGTPGEQPIREVVEQHVSEHSDEVPGDDVDLAVDGTPDADATLADAASEVGTPEVTDEADPTDEAAGEAAGEDTGEDAADEEPEEEDPLEEFRRELWAKPGDWFVVHTYSGMENRVKANLENRITSLNMEPYIHEVIVPTEEVAEIKNGQRKMVKRTVLPGYVLVRMDLTDESWNVVRNTPNVTGLVGGMSRP